MKPHDAPEFWRTLAERDGCDLHELLGDEFASRLPEMPDTIERRAFLKLMAASMALAGMTGCTRQPVEQILPYVRQPESIVPGQPLFYATAMTYGGCATGLLVESHEGRPTKVEGNPLHPASLGATDVYAQASLLDLYDPDRLQTLTYLGEIRPWSSFIGAMRSLTTAQQASKGAGLRFLTEAVCSPTLAAQMDEILNGLPSAVWHQWEPASGVMVSAGARMAFGADAATQYALDRAAVVVTLDADLLNSGPGHLRHASQFAARRRPDGAGIRLYAAESMPTPTGSRADHRLPVAASVIERVARELATQLGVAGASSSGDLSSEIRSWIQAVRNDLNAHRGESIVVAGEYQPPVVHALAHAINAALGNAGRTVVYTDSVQPKPVDHLQSIRDLAAAMHAGQVEALIVLGGNPVSTAPADLRFADAMQRVGVRVHLSLHADETSALCHWQVPATHFLEAWSDARAFDGTVSIVQPLIAPLYDGKSAHEVLSVFTDRPEQSPYDLVRAFWQRAHGGSEFDAMWRRTVHDGVMPSTAFPARQFAVRGSLPGATSSSGGGIDISIRHDPMVSDGRFANNAWLQELPKPLTALTWDNAILVSPAMLARLGGSATPALTGGERGQISSPIAEIRYRGRSIRGAVFPVAGHPDQTATIHLGYGRTRAGHVGTGRGFNAGALQFSDALFGGPGAQLALTGERFPLACTQYHHLMEGRDLIRVVSRAQLAEAAGAQAEERAGPLPSLFPDVEYSGYKWGMAIDVNACIGCNACVVACQAENNVPVVGKDEVVRGREMHWLRVDTYNEGAVESPHTYFQPVPCMQCENAPCEVVCPVGATVHSHEGLNEMVYNRCVGTRYCSNNCPYKVRRFNFFLYQDWNTPSLKLGRNPDVSVRSRGVMEKCTYCVQRINEAKIAAEKENRRVHDGDIVTACQGVCPTQAIVFGDVNDPESRVAKLKGEERNYALLKDLNTRPRTTYLAAISDRNPELAPKS